MDQIAPADKTTIEQQIIQLMTSSLEAKTLEADQTHLIANFVLEHLEAVQTHAELVNFLSSLAEKWPIFAPLGNIEMGKTIAAHRDELTHNVMDKVKSGDIDGALEMAQSLTPHTT